MHNGFGKLLPNQFPKNFSKGLSKQFPSKLLKGVTKKLPKKNLNMQSKGFSKKFKRETFYFFFFEGISKGITEDMSKKITEMNSIEIDKVTYRNFLKKIPNNLWTKNKKCFCQRSL